MAESLRFDPEFIKTQLAGLSRRHLVVFTAACCERMLPNYASFVKAECWGNVAVLRTALDEVWSYGAGADFPEEQFVALQARCQDLIPDTEEFPTLHASHALDAGVGIYETLQLCLDGDLDHVVNVASSARDTVDMHIQERDNLDYQSSDFERRILTHPLMIRELRYQIDDLEAIRNQHSLSEQFVEGLRKKYLGRSSIA